MMTNEEAIARIEDHKIAHKMNEPRAIYISEALDVAIQAIKQITWIPITERPPETGERVLVLFADGFVMIGSYLDWEDGSPVTWVLDGQEDYNVDINNIVAWMSTPPSYKENEI